MHSSVMLVFLWARHTRHTFNQKKKKLTACRVQEYCFCSPQNLWIERITYTTEFELPGILKWFEVVDQRLDQLCPPEYACETVERNNKQIRQISLHYRANPQVSNFTVFDISCLLGYKKPLLIYTDWARTFGRILISVLHIIN